MSSDRVLLPTNVRPVRYAISLEPNFTTFKADGTEVVYLQVKESTSQIVLHSREIKIHTVSVSQNGQEAQAKNISYDEKEQRATFDFANALQIGDAELKIHFEAVLNDEMAGFYRSKYTSNGEDRYAAVTQFEPTDARRAFPCWDEPAVKAIFEITLVIPTDRVGLSNMLPVDEKVEGSKKTIKFAPSPIMSTYLVAFVVGEFEYLEDTTAEGVKVRVYTPIGRKEEGRFALLVGKKTLSYFTEYFGIPYPLPKMDMIAIADFSAGAMENWGLVTYRETALLCDEKSPVSSKQRVAYVVAHELAHQWFGNLVTMEWWSQLWLNEGFATFVGNLATNYLFPEWDIWTIFVNDYQSTAFSLDGLKNSHPIEVEVRTSDQISEIFDAISYNKGSCIIRMLEAYLGEKNFQKGLHTYLTRFEYKNAVTEDLWQALGEASGVDVRTFMDTFTKAVGYPMVSVKHGAKEGTLEVSQTRFLANGESTQADPVVWSLALQMASASQKSLSTFTTKSSVVEVPFKKDEWVKVNAGQPGFYRVRYSAEMLEKLTTPLRQLALPPVDRLGVQGDVFALARAGLLPTSQFLDIALALTNEEDYTVWTALDANIGTLMSVWKHEPVAPKLAAFARKLFAPIFAKLGWDARAGEKPGDTLLRGAVLRRLGTGGDAQVVEEAKRRFARYLEDSSSLAADLKSAVFEIVLANGDQSVHDSMIKLYQKAETADDRTRIVRLLPEQPTEALSRKALEFSLSPEVRDQDRFMAFYSIHGVPHGTQLAWDFLRENWDTYLKKFPKGSAILTRIIGKSTDSFTVADKAKEVEKFFEEHPYAAAERTVRQSIESILARASWLDSARDDVAKWLEANKL